MLRSPFSGPAGLWAGTGAGAAGLVAGRGAAPGVLGKLTTGA
ncbi:hypothetical protein [Streptomyces sp. NPDC001348]